MNGKPQGQTVKQRLHELSWHDKHARLDNMAGRLNSIRTELLHLGMIDAARALDRALSNIAVINSL